jgi:predicted RNase H-like HicB family nuclease
MPTLQGSWPIIEIDHFRASAIAYFKDADNAQCGSDESRACRFLGQFRFILARRRATIDSLSVMRKAMPSPHAIAYPVTLTIAEGTVLVTCEDLPEFHSIGSNEEEAMANAPHRLATTLRMYRQDGRRFPKPSECLPGQHLVPVRSIGR